MLLEVFAVVFAVFVSFSSDKTVILSGFDVCEAWDNISMSHARSASEFNGNCLRIFYNNRNAIVQFLAVRLQTAIQNWFFIIFKRIGQLIFCDVFNEHFKC